MLWSKIYGLSLTKTKSGIPNICEKSVKRIYDLLWRQMLTYAVVVSKPGYANMHVIRVSIRTLNIKLSWSIGMEQIHN